MNYNEQINAINPDTMKLIIEFGVRSNSINNIQCKPLINFSYKIVKVQLPELLKENKYIEIAKLLFKNKLKNIDANELLYFILWVRDNLQIIYENELKYLSSPPDTDLFMADIESLNVFGELNVIDAIAGGDALKWELVWTLKYSTIFDKLLKNKYEGIVQKNYKKIIENKSK
jgi:hypothetical protein